MAVPCVDERLAEAGKTKLFIDEACLIEDHSQFLRDEAGDDGASARRTGSDLRITYSP